ncbi:MAG: DUF5076 domain-containing protein [Candidatus Cybelea sp.]|jgi:hypothetical protein
MQRLSVPEVIDQNPDAVEILCAWALPGDEIGFVSTKFPVDDPAGLGIFFADLARHYFEVAGMERDSWPKALRRVADGLIAEAEQ